MEPIKEAVMLRVLLQEMRFRRNGIIGWGLGIAALPLIYIGLYPQIEDQMEAFEEILKLPIYQAMGMSLVDLESYIASTVILIVPILVSIYAIINATATLAGEEDDGKLELIVTLPIPRWQIVATKATAVGIALFLVLFIVGTLAALTFAAIESQITTAISPGTIFMGLIYAWPLVMSVAMIALFLGAFSPSRRVAALLSTVVFIISYFGSNLAGRVDSIEPFEPFFLFTYLDSTSNLLINGAETSDILVLLAVALMAFLLAVLFFQWRNITVGAWPWQRGQMPD
jgi:ABC-2 type transport system permease protein